MRLRVYAILPHCRPFFNSSSSFSSTCRRGMLSFVSIREFSLLRSHHSRMRLWRPFEVENEWEFLVGWNSFCTAELFDGWNNNFVFVWFEAVARTREKPTKLFQIEEKYRKTENFQLKTQATGRTDAVVTDDGCSFWMILSQANSTTSHHMCIEYSTSENDVAASPRNKNYIAIDILFALFAHFTLHL